MTTKRRVAVSILDPFKPIIGKMLPIVKEDRGPIERAFNHHHVRLERRHVRDVPLRERPPEYRRARHESGKRGHGLRERSETRAGSALGGLAYGGMRVPLTADLTSVRTALAAMTGALSFKHAKAGLVRDLIAARVVGGRREPVQDGEQGAALRGRDRRRSLQPRRRLPPQPVGEGGHE